MDDESTLFGYSVESHLDVVLVGLDGFFGFFWFFGMISDVDSRELDLGMGLR
jgi:hypothetical protein